MERKLCLMPLTRIPQNMEISKAVGTTWNNTEVRRNEIPLMWEQRTQLVSCVHLPASADTLKRPVPMLMRFPQYAKRTHFVPLSMALVNPPVFLARWNEISKFNRWANTFLATLLIAPWATFANTAFLNSLNKDENTRARPSVVFHSNDTKCEKYPSVLSSKKNVFSFGRRVG